ncbi:hypothetical protein Acr_21g0011690 [Actinidia rufa]|uniref:Uncharacterized protein n=1 Tax=Actinidia rufa TaxID=165716 RepID=A0A7J0GID1_9ERIC|nr:hypothetical protein Acr_21g0011690 [Actinidia rufa]
MAPSFAARLSAPGRGFAMREVKTDPRGRGPSLGSLGLVVSSRQRTLGSEGQHVFDYLKQMQAEDPGFFCAVQGDFENPSGNILG